MHEKPQKAATPVQIHMLQIAKQLEKLPMAQVKAVKTKPITKELVKKRLQCHNYKEQKEITLEILKGVPKERLPPTMQKL